MPVFRRQPRTVGTWILSRVTFNSTRLFYNNSLTAREIEAYALATEPVLSSPSVTSTQGGSTGGWGENWNFSVNVQDDDTDDVTVQLWRDDGDSTFDATVDTLVETTTSDAGGHYLFSGQAAGTYFVSVDDSQAVLSGYSETTTDAQTGANAAGIQIDVILAADAGTLDADFGFRDTGLATISGSLWDDWDADGTATPAWHTCWPGSGGPA